MNIITSRSVHAEIWFRDKLLGDTKLYSGDFGNFDFLRILRGSIDYDPGKKKDRRYNKFQNKRNLNLPKTVDKIQIFVVHDNFTC